MNDQIQKISARSVRYIKLGEKGTWEHDCIANNTIRFGFYTGQERILGLCRSGSWDELRTFWLRDEQVSASTATRFTNETRKYFDDHGDTLWITFVEDRLYWGFLENTKPESHDHSSSFRKVRDGWKCQDVYRNDLTKWSLSGAITKLAAYRGTSCAVDVGEQVIARINAEDSEHVKAARKQYVKLSEVIVPLINSLHDKDFESLVDLIFASSGWRRVSKVGGTQKTTDFDLLLPSTGERAFVQVKSRTDQKEFNEYAGRMKDTSAERMFFAYHTGTIANSDSEITLLDGSKISRMAINAGLTEWIIDKTS